MMKPVTAVPDLVRTLASNQFLFAQLARRSFAARHAGSVLGWLWALINSAVLFGLYLVVFSLVLGMRVAEPPGVSFGVFLMTGLVPFMTLSETTSRAATVFRAHAGLVQRVRFPAAVLVVGDAVGTVAHNSLAFAVVVGICLQQGTVRPAGLGATVLGLALLTLWCLGLALMAAVAGAFLPDVGEALALAFQVLFFAAPIVYPLSMINRPLLRLLIEANPVTGLVRLIRVGLMGSAPPDPWMIVSLTIGGILLFALGAASLERWRLRIPDVL